MKCRVCHERLAARVLGLCAECIRRGVETDLLALVHSSTRRQFGLPETAPRSDGGVKCNLCANLCRIGQGQRGFCGLRENADGKLVTRAGTWRAGHAQWYYDPLPTNCVASWVCPEGENSEWFRQPSQRPVHRRNNLAVFYEACTFNCLFCQNWSFRAADQSPHVMTAAELAECADEHTACICFFGGDPAAQMPHALKTAELALARRPGSLRICWETNGNMNPRLAKRAAEISLRSGGCVKFDLKAWTETLHRCLTAASNRQTLDNFRMVAEMGASRRQPPLVIASILLVPGYLDDTEMAQLARFIASVDPDTPCSLLAFHPDFYFSDLPTTSRAHAERAEAICRQAGLRNIHIGNQRLLGSTDYV